MTSMFRRVLVIAAFTAIVPRTRSNAAAIPEDVIKRAVDRGVAALKKGQAADGSFGGKMHRSGPTSLAALALLECGVAVDDEQVRSAAAYVRNDCPDTNETYNLALAIMFLDRLGDPLDETIIQVLTARLLEGQQPSGGWSYTSPPVQADEAKALRTLIEQRAELKTAPGRTSAPERAPPAAAILERARRAQRRTTASQPDVLPDNSNTQFAILGLWVGRRHGLPTEIALRRAEAYFRATQIAGRWPYRPGPDIPSDGPANTCAGLVGLAIGAGLVRERQLRNADDGKVEKSTQLRDPLRDAAVQVAMNFVGTQVAALAVKGLTGDPMRDLYFLWSIERTGMIYTVAVMGGVNWYQIGALMILRGQMPDGSWGAGAGPGTGEGNAISTSFALLFLGRSNVAHDLSANLRKKMEHPALRAGNEKGEPAEAALPLSEAESLARELPAADPYRQTAILVLLRDGKGAEYTDVLAKAIDGLNGEIQKKARDALAERLARMTAATLRGKLKDANVEVRRAAALACAMKSDKEFIGDLVRTLDDPDRWVTRAAAVALRTLTGEDYGPSAAATAEEKARAIAAWKAWWKRQGGR